VCVCISVCLRLCEFLFLFLCLFGVDIISCDVGVHVCVFVRLCVYLRVCVCLWRWQLMLQGGEDP